MRAMALKGRRAANPWAQDMNFIPAMSGPPAEEEVRGGGTDRDATLLPTPILDLQLCHQLYLRPSTPLFVFFAFLCVLRRLREEVSRAVLRARAAQTPAGPRRPRRPPPAPAARRRRRLAGRSSRGKTRCWRWPPTPGHGTSPSPRWAADHRPGGPTEGGFLPTISFALLPLRRSLPTAPSAPAAIVARQTFPVPEKNPVPSVPAPLPVEQRAAGQRVPDRKRFAVLHRAARRVGGPQEGERMDGWRSNPKPSPARLPARESLSGFLPSSWPRRVSPRRPCSSVHKY